MKSILIDPFFWLSLVLLVCLIVLFLKTRQKRTPKLGRLGSKEVVRDRHDSHLHKNVASLLPLALKKLNSGNRDFICEEVEMGKIIGTTICVETNEGDDIIYAKRPKRFGHTRFVKNRIPTDCSTIVVIIKKVEKEYILITSFIGALAEPEPWDRKATDVSREFWNTHALIFNGEEEIIPGSETKVCPWDAKIVSKRDQIDIRDDNEIPRSL